jgi:hypothetical protein
MPVSLSLAHNSFIINESMPYPSVTHNMPYRLVYMARPAHGLIWCAARSWRAEYPNLGRKAEFVACPANGTAPSSNGANESKNVWVGTIGAPRLRGTRLIVLGRSKLRRSKFEEACERASGLSSSRKIMFSDPTNQPFLQAISRSGDWLLTWADSRIVYGNPR